jgi:hypothetical protein
LSIRCHRWMSSIRSRSSHHSPWTDSRASNRGLRSAPPPRNGSGCCGTGSSGTPRTAWNSCLKHSGSPGHRGRREAPRRSVIMLYDDHVGVCRGFHDHAPSGLTVTGEPSRGDRPGGHPHPHPVIGQRRRSQPRRPPRHRRGLPPVQVESRWVSRTTPPSTSTPTTSLTDEYTKARQPVAVAGPRRASREARATNSGQGSNFYRSDTRGRSVRHIAVP